MTPNIAIVRIQTGNWWKFPIVLPLFLLWIPVILLGPFLLLFLGAVCTAADVSFSATVVTMWKILCSLPGTDIRVGSEGSQVAVRIL